MHLLMDYLISNPLIAIFLCLGLGYLLGNRKIKAFSFGATAATLLIGIGLCLLAQQFGDPSREGLAGRVNYFTIDSNLKNCFFAMFAFTLGYDVGPAFFQALRSSGVRIVALAAVHAVVTGVCIWLVCGIFGYGRDVGVGLLAGAFTTSAATGACQGGSTSLVYSLTYSVGTVCAISFVRFLAPKILDIDLLTETKKHLDSMEVSDKPAAPQNSDILQVRALRIAPGSPCAGRTVDRIEADYSYRLEVETIARGDRRIRARQQEILREGDILTVIGDISSLSHFDGQGLEEVADAQYFQIQQRTEQIVLTVGDDRQIRRRLTGYSIIIRHVRRNGRILDPAGMVLQAGDVLEVFGPDVAIDEAAKSLGYIKNNGITTDIPFFSLAMAGGLAVATVSLWMLNRKIPLGTSFGALVVGLLCGWWYENTPRFGHISTSTRWFIKSIGLNFYIAISGLTATMTLEELLSWQSLEYILVGIVLAVVVRTVVLLVGKYVLKLDNVDLLGGICGSATSTPALNALAEYTGSSVYALSYAPGYAVGNVLLILTGIVLANLIP